MTENDTRMNIVIRGHCRWMLFPKAGINGETISDDSARIFRPMDRPAWQMVPYRCTAFASALDCNEKVRPDGRELIGAVNNDPGYRR